MGTEKARRKSYFPALRGKSTRWTGITNVLSGTSTIVVSATQIKSGAAIMTGLGITSVASHRGLIVSVNSLVANTSMVIQTNIATVDSQQVYYTVIENA